VAAVPALLTGHVALNLARALAQSGEQRELLCVDDELAGVGNRRQFLRLAERDWARCRRYGDDGAMLLIDADYLRRINDTMGQRCGDAVLLEVTRRVSATLRQSDVLARFGGAVLAVFLPHTDPLGRWMPPSASASRWRPPLPLGQGASGGHGQRGRGPCARRPDGAGRADPGSRDGAACRQGCRAQLRACRPHPATAERSFPVGGTGLITRPMNEDGALGRRRHIRPDRFVRAGGQFGTR
jgi:GGDEF domain-containing protein